MFRSGQTIVSKDWTPDLGQARHYRARLGFILMSTDLAAETDYFDMAPDGVGVHVTRLKTEDSTINETLARHLDTMAEAASRLQPDARPDVISYSCTSGSIVNGEDRVFAEIQKGAPWAQPMCMATGVADALHALGARKIVVGTPYIDEINTLEAEFLLSNGFCILNMQGLKLKTGLEFGAVTPDYWITFARAIDHPEADAIFLSCSGIRSLEVVEKIEQQTGKPVITSNQANFWSCLRRAGIDDALQGFGQIFSHAGRTLMRPQPR